MSFYIHITIDSALLTWLQKTKQVHPKVSVELVDSESDFGVYRGTDKNSIIFKVFRGASSCIVILNSHELSEIFCDFLRFQIISMNRGPRISSTAEPLFKVTKEQHHVGFGRTKTNTIHLSVTAQAVAYVRSLDFHRWTSPKHGIAFYVTDESFNIEGFQFEYSKRNNLPFVDGPPTNCTKHDFFSGQTVQDAIAEFNALLAPITGQDRCVILGVRQITETRVWISKEAHAAIVDTTIFGGYVFKTHEKDRLLHYSNGEKDVLIFPSEYVPDKQYVLEHDCEVRIPITWNYLQASLIMLAQHVRGGDDKIRFY